MRKASATRRDVREMQEEEVIPAVHDPEFRREAMEAVARVAASGRFVLGEEVEAFESELAEFCGVKHAVGMSSGTDALLASLMALGIGPGDEVIVPNFSFAATATCVSRVGAVPVFVGVRPMDFHVTGATVRDALSERTRAVVAAHLFGACCDVESFVPLPPGVSLVEDAAQALGASLRGRKAGASGIAGCFSFFPTKNLGAWGDAGAIVTNDDGFAVVLRSLRCHGGLRPYEHERLGGNFRLDEIQAAVLRVGMRRLPAWNEARRRAADAYAKALSDVPYVVLPTQHDGSTWHQYVVRFRIGRATALARLLSSGIEARIYYPTPLHVQPCFGRVRHAVGTAEKSEALCRESLALPIHPWIRYDEIGRTRDVLMEVMR